MTEAWTATGERIDLVSGWIQNHRITGVLDATGPLRLVHGLSPGDETAPIRYVR